MQPRSEHLRRGEFSRLETLQEQTAEAFRKRASSSHIPRGALGVIARFEGQLFLCLGPPGGQEDAHNETVGGLQERLKVERSEPGALGCVGVLSLLQRAAKHSRSARKVLLELAGRSWNGMSMPQALAHRPETSGCLLVPFAEASIEELETDLLQVTGLPLRAM